MEPFRNEPVLELRRAPVRARLADALAALDAELPLAVGVRIGDATRPGDALVSTDPGAPDRVVARAAVATPEEVDAALDAATAAAPAWRDTPAAERAAILIRAADLLRRDRLRIAALILRETAKPWPEADADVCEAIDFLEYYARGAVELERGSGLLQMPGERNDLRWAGRGVVAVISPWNFPVAIACGMTAAGLATGNTVVLKPAEQAPACAAVLVDALRTAGVPAGALSLLPGEGDVGARLVADPRVHTIAFTGSGAVGLEILRVAAEVRRARSTSSG
jgi:RHH-type proline utilization regulon transcriptional repressor/proline dehydrogenase/delta 1-pyrroline-5-carboxylate dehydrogenase